MFVSGDKCFFFAALAAVGLIFSVAEPSAAQWSLTWLGPVDEYETSLPNAISTDGSTIVGLSRRGDYHIDEQRQAFRWTQPDGMVGLGFLLGHAWSEAEDVSADGSVIVGYSQAAIGEHSTGEAFRWTQADAMQGLDFLPGDSDSWATGVSADGLVVVGYSKQGGDWDTQKAFRWTPEGGMEDLGYPTGGTAARATAVSADGAIVVGEWGTPTSWGRGFLWTQSKGIVDLSSLPGGGPNYVYDVSANGSVVVGEHYTLGAVLWTEAGGLVDLDPPPSVYEHSAALAVSSDGSLVVGHGDQLRPFLWDATHGTRELTELLVADGVDLGIGYLQSARDVFFDGQTIVIVGEGLDADGVGLHTWVARCVIPEPSSLTILISMGAIAVVALVGRWRGGRRRAT